MNNSDTAVLDQVFDPITRCLTPDVALRVAALRAPSPVQERIDDLADKCSDGSLSPNERDEYEAWIRAINFLGILQAKARKMMAAESP